ncbi:RICIN domain-containing protein [Sediminispirochaeta bajacaliforniensis]|uniref:RICIN domain-containing protein n=1 Tax=Sediminispirochaeta bajacaliforniensis TaxID=148 RepID=UPI000378295D|nr:RICIN domain-containing protein [Sediminispirochaeta bajacaliforniensis]
MSATIDVLFPSPYIESENQLFLDVKGGSKDNKVPLILYPQKDVNNQKFVFQQLPDGSHLITALHSGKAIDVSGGSDNDGAAVIQYSYHDLASNQWWFVLPAARDGYVKLVCNHSEKCLDVPGAHFSSETNVQQHRDNGTQAQMFKLIAV